MIKNANISNALDERNEKPIRVRAGHIGSWTYKLFADEKSDNM